MWFKKKDFKKELQSNYNILKKMKSETSRNVQFYLRMITRGIPEGLILEPLLRDKFKVFVGNNIKEITKYEEDKVMKFEFKESTGLGVIRYDAGKREFINLKNKDEEMMSELLLVTVWQMHRFANEISDKKWRKVRDRIEKEIEKEEAKGE